MTNREEQFNGLPATCIEAKAVAIESDSLVLKSVETGELLHWPLNKLNKPYQIGGSLKLALYNEEEEITYTQPLKDDSIKQHPSPPSKINEAEKRKLLEKLLN